LEKIALMLTGLLKRFGYAGSAHSVFAVGNLTEALNPLSYTQRSRIIQDFPTSSQEFFLTKTFQLMILAMHRLVEGFRFLVGDPRFQELQYC